MQTQSASLRFAGRASFALLALCLFTLPHGCSSKSGAGTDAGPSDSGPGDSGPDAGDAGPHDSGTPGCTTDAQCGTQRWCEKTTGVCQAAKPCPQGQGNCDYQLSTPDYCAGQTCYCDPTDTSCKPLHLPCTACSDSAQCGDDPNAFDTPANCLPPSDGFADASVCIPRRDGYSDNCPQGFQLPTDGGVYCSPAGGVCGAAGGCHSDQDCDPHSATPICDTTRSVCVAACTFDLKTGESLCPTNEVCNLTPALAALPPSDPNYAKGECAPPCTQGTNCGQGLVCRSEGVDMQVMRCGLPAPECLGDVECPSSNATNSNGYCDLAAHQCHTDCRSTSDCVPGYACTGAAGNQSCVAETCLQAGGAELGCDYGQFCCGESNSPAPCPGGVQSGACYDAPALWCSTCSQDSDCTGGSDPNRTGDANLCVQDSAGNDVCAFGCDANTSGECPRGWDCLKVVAACSQNSDCGDQATANCDLPSDGGTNGICSCSQNGDCPQGPPAATCAQGQCVITHVCSPNCQ